MPTNRSPVGFVILTHGDPDHLHRLIAALAAAPVFVHCDSATPAATFRRMVADTPAPVVALPRRRTKWGTWALVEAELDSLRAALDEGVERIVVMSGAEYPLVGRSAMTERLAQERSTSCLELHPLPYDGCVRGGFFRVRHRWWLLRGHGVRPPWSRPLPPDVCFHGGSQWKILSHRHAAALLRVAEGRPDLCRFFATSLIPDELFVPSMLRSPSLVGDLADSVHDVSMWYTDFPGLGAWNPRWLGAGDYQALAAASAGTDGEPSQPKLFARKISCSVDATLVDRLDAELGLRCP